MHQYKEHQSKNPDASTISTYELTKPRFDTLYQIGVLGLAQRVGFEPTGPIKGLPDFESGPL